MKDHSDNNGREDVMTLVVNIMTFQIKALARRTPSSCTLTTTTTAGSVPADARQVRSYTGDEDKIA